VRRPDARFGGATLGEVLSQPQLAEKSGYRQKVKNLMKAGRTLYESLLGPVGLRPWSATSHAPSRLLVSRRTLRSEAQEGRGNPTAVSIALEGEKVKRVSAVSVE
jgi:hypothetical protein